jgi:BirA family transcriptional regulator, biotin operon repressor / biotin---[acetyl-CoA-carboxylase] ligase
MPSVGSPSTIADGEMENAPLDVDRILATTFVARVEHHVTLASTNDRAAQAARETGGAMPLLVVADCQTAGRGRGVNRWWTGPRSLAFSLSLPPEQVGATRSKRCPLIAPAVAVGVVDALASRLPPGMLGIHWPNDVFAAGRKLAGILVEVLSDGRHIIGIGLNVNDTAAEAPEGLRDSVATLRDLTGRAYDRTEILMEVLKNLEAVLACLTSEPEKVAARADELCLQRGKILTVQQPGGAIAGRCLGIAPNGALILETSEGPRTIYSEALNTRPS